MTSLYARRARRGAAVVAALLLAAAWPATEHAAQSVTLVEVGEIPGPANLVRVRDGIGYVAGGHNFTIHDLSDPANPVAQGAHAFPQEIWGFRLAGDRAYVGANFFGLGIVDISDPDNPTLLSQHQTLGQAKIGASASGKVGIIDHMEGFVLVDVSDETAPAGIGSYFLDGYARDVVTAGTIAYATDSPSGLYVFDLARPGMPEPVGIVHAPAAPRDIEVSVGTGGRPTLIVGAGGGNLQVYDVSDPVAPAKLASFETPGRAVNVSLDGHLAYVADTEQGVQVVDLSDPANPVAAGAFGTPRPARDVAAHDGLVLVVVGDSEREGEDRHVLILERR
ncbi:MAG: hypothetical protein F4Y45_09400 [Acidobacteria bacterium]|nr:hypothetical protein [Acidobacteriota bacterium]MYJ05354.1 hypothetical protein [Acidobacteriota bacterium]